MKTFKTCFSAVFMALLILPGIFMNRKEDAVSESEKRKLAEKPRLQAEDGSLNRNFTADFETYFNDRIGFRDRMVMTNAQVQYYVFGQIDRGGIYNLGPHGELNYIGGKVLKDYTRTNLPDEAELLAAENAFRNLTDYMEEQGAVCFYLQCWDKHSIYPEQFSQHVKQYEPLSMTDRYEEVLLRNPDLHVIETKEKLLDAKDDFEVYTVWGDPAHWSRRGARIAYRAAMEKINEVTGGDYRILTDEDYDLTSVDTGMTIFNAIHRPCMEPAYTLKAPEAVRSGEKPKIPDDSRNVRFTNDAAGNDTTLLIMGDSYINSYLIKDLAESFGTAILIWGDYIKDMRTIMETYHPDIVLFENAERVPRFKMVQNTFGEQ